MDYKTTKNTLEKKQLELQKRLDAISADLQKSHSADFAEQVTERENDDVLQSLKIETSNELKQVNTALQRIDSGDYGICTACGKAIAEQRLIVLPEANTCIQCASQSPA